MKQLENKYPLGLIPRKNFEENIKVQRFLDICNAIKRYYENGLKIKIEWIKEYNDLLDFYNDYQERNKPF